MRNYRFEVQCKSGAVKIFECEAPDFRRARVLLDAFIANN